MLALKTSMFLFHFLFLSENRELTIYLFHKDLMTLKSIQVDISLMTLDEQDRFIVYNVYIIDMFIHWSNNHLLLSLIIFHRWKIRTVTRTGCRSLMRRRRKRCSGGCWGGPLGCIPTSSCFRTTLVFPRMKSFTHGRISQGRWWHGRRLVTERCHHGQGGPS